MKVHSEAGYVEAVFTGHVEADELVTFARQVVDAANESEHPRMLSDLSAMTGGHTPADLASLAGDLEWKPGTREAIVLPHEMSRRALERIYTWSQACVAAGLDIRLFDTPGRAVDWLTSA